MPNYNVACMALFILLVSPLTQAYELTLQHEVLQSKHLNEERKVTVQLPKSYSSNSDKVYPVIYILGASGNLPMLSGMLDRMQQSDAAPEVILVVIENTDRLRDLTPTVNYDPRGPVGKGGGGDSYLDFIELELIPHINKTYRTHDFKIVSGSSIGGLLVIHSLQSRPHLFQAHMAYSPAVWWGDTTTAKKTKEFMANTKTLNNYLYMDIGEEGGDMRVVYDDLLSFIQQNKPANFKLKSDVFADVAHGLTSAAGVFNAYHNLFLPLRMPNSALTDGPKSIVDYYKKLSWQRGETITPIEWVIRELAYHLINENDLPAAIELFKFNIELYPESAPAHNGLAYGFEKNQQFSDALKQVNLALKFAKEGDDGYDIFTQRRDRLKPLVKDAEK